MLQLIVVNFEVIFNRKSSPSLWTFVIHYYEILIDPPVLQPPKAKKIDWGKGMLAKCRDEEVEKAH